MVWELLSTPVLVSVAVLLALAALRMNVVFALISAAAVGGMMGGLDGEAFARDLLDALTNPARRESMRAAAKGLAQDRAAQHLADELESLTHA